MLARSLLVLSSAIVLAALSGGCSTSNGDPATDEPGVAGSAGVCAAAASWAGQCSAEKSTCDDAILETCDGVSGLLNASVTDAAATCLRDAACGSSPTRCLAQSVTKAETRDSHKKLAEAFCDCLPTGKSACVEAIATGEGPAKAALAIALPLGDDLATAIADKCTTTPGCSATFSACAQGVVAKKLAETLSAEGATCLAKSVLEAGAAAANGGGNDGEDQPPADEQDEPGGATCEPKTCAQLGVTCGTHDDGCGSTVLCGACTSQCQPKTCAQLGKSCGNHPDGCGGTASCGTCSTSCNADAAESNNTWATAKDLGATTDSPDSKKSAYNLSLPDLDEDWFKTKVTDGGFDGNPRVTASVARAVEVSVFYKCDAGGDASTCPNTLDKPDNTVGKGCRGTSNAQVKASCSGISDNGTAYIRVRKLASDGQCVGYSLDVHVD